MRELMPNFFIVGAPKSGTTSWHYNLKKHPEIYMTEPKEPQYFCDDLHEKAAESFYKYKKRKDYLALFSDVSSEKVIGESSTHYLYSKNAAERIYSFNPEAKILIFLRNPIDFLYSWHSHLLRGSCEKVANFEKALKLEERRKADIQKIKDIPCPYSFLFYNDVANFSKQIERYFSIFPKNNIKIIIMDDYKKDITKVYKEVLSFLGVEDQNFLPDFEVKNTNLNIRSHFLNNFLRKRNSKLKNFLKLGLNKNIVLGLRKKILKLNVTPGKRKNMDEGLKKELKNKFKSEVEEISKLLNRDLIKLWDYDN